MSLLTKLVNARVKMDVAVSTTNLVRSLSLLLCAVKDKGERDRLRKEVVQLVDEEAEKDTEFFVSLIDQHTKGEITTDIMNTKVIAYLESNHVAI